MGYPVPEHGWSRMTTPDDAIGYDRFYEDLPSTPDIVYPSAVEMGTYVRMVEKGTAAHADQFSAEDVAGFKKIYIPQFSYIKAAHWVCPKNTRSVIVPKSALYSGNEMKMIPGSSVTRIRPADMLALYRDTKDMDIADGYDFSPLAILFGTIGHIPDWDLLNFKKNDEMGNKSGMRALICGTCGNVHRGGSYISWIRSIQFSTEKVAFTPGSISIMQTAREPYGANLRLLDRHRVPLTSLKNVMEYTTKSEGGHWSYENSIRGVNKQSIAAFIELKQEGVNAVLAGEWAIALSGFKFVWDDAHRLLVRELISSGIKPSSLDGLWHKLFTYGKNEPIKQDLYLALRVLQNDIDPSMLSALRDAV